MWYFKFIFIFYIGSTFGYLLELFFRRWAHGSWVNPGALVGPYLPIYGFGLVALTAIYEIFKDLNVHPIMIILLMGLSMTLIELIGGLAALKNNVRLWDYRNEWGNYKGIICPLFSLIWTLLGAVYYFLIAPHIMDALVWFSKNLTFCYVLGLFTGFILIDVCYSGNVFAKVRKYAKENDITVKYEKLKMQIKDLQEKANEKNSFIFPFKGTKNLRDYIKTYKKQTKKENKKRE